MFDLALRAYTQPGPTRYMPKINGYLNTLSQELIFTSHRFIKGLYTETRGMMLLEHVIGSAPIEAMMGTKDPYERYRKHLVPARESLERIFDPVQIGPSTSVMFLDASHTSSHQYLFPVTSKSVYGDYPFGMGWDAWSRARPFRVASLMTNELTFHAYQDTLKYRRDPPTIAIFTLDVCALVMMFCAYLDTFGNLDNVPNNAVPTFLHRYVVFPALSDDSVQLWVRNQYHECLRRRISKESSHKDYVWVTANNGRIGTQYPQFIDEAYQLMSLAKTSSLLPNGYLASLNLLHGENILSYYQKVSQYMTTPPLKQYRWAEYLINERWLDLFIRTMLLNPTWSEFMNAATYLRRDLQLLYASSPWSNAHDRFVQTYIQTSINDKLAMLDNAIAGQGG